MLVTSGCRTDSHCVIYYTVVEWKREALFLLALFENSKSRLFLRQCDVLVYCLLQGCMEEDSSFGFFLSLYSRVI